MGREKQERLPSFSYWAQTERNLGSVSGCVIVWGLNC